MMIGSGFDLNLAVEQINKQLNQFEKIRIKKFDIVSQLSLHSIVAHVVIEVEDQ